MGGSVYAFAGGKGGVGKTTVTANAAIALQETGYEVAIADIDLAMTNLGQLFDIDQEYGIHDVLSGQRDVESVVVEGPSGIDIVPGPSTVDEFGDADPANLRDVTGPLRDSYDIVLLDTGAGISHQNMVATGRACGVVLVTTPKEMAAKNVSKTKEMVAQVDGEIAGLVVTRVKEQTDRETASELADVLGTDLLAAIPEYHEQAEEPRVQTRSGPATTEYGRLATALSVYHQTGDSARAADTAAEVRAAAEYRQGQQAEKPPQEDGTSTQGETPTEEEASTEPAIGTTAAGESDSGTDEEDDDGGLFGTFLG